jgi:hypothetical protein
MKYECPICQALLNHEREDDGIICNEVSKSGEVIEVYNDNNGGDRVYCSNVSSHEIPQNLYQAVLDIV